jgi:hypothetical protein
MAAVFKLIDKIPLALLLVFALLFALAPFQPEPHLLEKTRMLFHGELTKPLDIFDLCLHATPLLVLVIRLLRLKGAS